MKVIVSSSGEIWTVIVFLLAKYINGTKRKQNQKFTL